jgi:hypothetical protein
MAGREVHQIFAIPRAAITSLPEYALDVAGKTEIRLT